MILSIVLLSSHSHADLHSYHACREWSVKNSMHFLIGNMCTRLGNGIGPPLFPFLAYSEGITCLLGSWLKLLLGYGKPYQTQWKLPPPPPPPPPPKRYYYNNNNNNNKIYIYIYIYYIYQEGTHPKYKANSARTSRISIWEQDLNGIFLLRGSPWITKS